MSTEGSIPSDARGLRVAVVVSRYNASVTDALLKGARWAFEQRGGRAEDLEILPVPGAFELTGGAAIATERGGFDAICALGCVIKGDTEHDVYINHAVAQGLSAVTVRTGVPVAFGVLTTNTPEQAIARAGGAAGRADGDNKGAEAMHAALDMALLRASLASGDRRGWMDAGSGSGDKARSAGEGR